jgi:acetyl esterase/lipase
VTLNWRELLRDYGDTPFVQRYLDQWRLAAQGDEQQLLQYYDSQEIERYEGLSRKEFLERAGVIKTACDAFGNDPFEDVDFVTVGYTPGDQGFLAIVVEGRFNRRNTVRLEHFFQQQLFPVNQDVGPVLTMLDDETLVFADCKQTMAAIQARATEQKGVLPAGVRALLESGRQNHLSLLVNNLETSVPRLTKFVDEKLVGFIGIDQAISNVIVGAGTDWIKKGTADYSAVSVAISVRDAKLRLEFGLDVKNAEQADNLRKLIDSVSFLGGQVLKAIDHDLARKLADILARRRTAITDTALIVHVDVPYEFITQLLENPSLDVFPDLHKANATTKPFPGLEDLRGLAWRATSFPIWKSGIASTEIEEVRDVLYQTGPGADPFRHRLDLFLPRNKQNFPIVVLVHGGGWDVGDNRCSGLYSSVGEFLASQGICAVLPNYRLSPQVMHPEHVQDVARAVAWARSHVGEYGGNAERLYLMGHSAGGHLVSLLAADESYLQAEGMNSADIKGVITFSGVYRIPEGLVYGALGGSGPRSLRLEHMLPLRGQSDPFWKWNPPGWHVAADIYGSAFGDSTAQRADASPITHVRRNMPRFLILSPEHDLPTLGPQADEFYAALCDKGCDARLLRVPRRNHNSLLFSAITPQDPAARAILEFVLK